MGRMTPNGVLWSWSARRLMRDMRKSQGARPTNAPPTTPVRRDRKAEAAADTDRRIAEMRARLDDVRAKHLAKREAKKAKKQGDGRSTT
jgi:hypothetical protein